MLPVIGLQKYIYFFTIEIIYPCYPVTDNHQVIWSRFWLKNYVFCKVNGLRENKFENSKYVRNL